MAHNFHTTNLDITSNITETSTQTKNLIMFTETVLKDCGFSKKILKMNVIGYLYVSRRGS
jgi:hypothetical protein